MIVDEDLEVVRNSFEGNTLIKGVPIMQDMGSILDYVGITFFEPPIFDIDAYMHFLKRLGLGFHTPSNVTQHSEKSNAFKSTDGLACTSYQYVAKLISVSAFVITIFFAR